jgi:hypothetical protein
MSKPPSEHDLHKSVDGRFASLPLAERFDRHWMPEPNSGCWLWLSVVTRHGYGTIRDDTRRVRLAHRVSYHLARGTIPDGMHVCHRCDVRSCVNPDHLFLGANADNQRDKTLKNRAGVKLTPARVMHIRADRRRLKDVAADHGVAPCTVSEVRRRKTWSHM